MRACKECLTINQRNTLSGSIVEKSNLFVISLASIGTPSNVIVNSKNAIIFLKFFIFSFSLSNNLLMMLKKPQYAMENFLLYYNNFYVSDYLKR